MGHPCIVWASGLAHVGHFVQFIQPCIVRDRALVCSLLGWPVCFCAVCSRPTLGVYHTAPIISHPVGSLHVLVASRPTLMAY